MKRMQIKKKKKVGIGGGLTQNKKKNVCPY